MTVGKGLAACFKVHCLIGSCRKHGSKAVMSSMCAENDGIAGSTWDMAGRPLGGGWGRLLGPGQEVCRMGGADGTATPCQAQAAAHACLQAGLSLAS